MSTIRRVYGCEIKAEGEGGKATRFQAIASTGDTDRQGEILHPDGHKLIAGAPLLYGHDYWSLRSNIGGLEKSTSNGKQVIVEGFFDDDIPEHTDAIIAAGKAKKGSLNHLSVGFNPSTVKMRDGEVRKLKPGEWIWPEPGTEYLEWEMVELSFVPVPANPNAELISARALEGPAGKEFRALLRGALEDILGSEEFIARLRAARAVRGAEPEANPTTVLDDLEELLGGAEAKAVANDSADPDALASALAASTGAEDELDQLFKDAGPAGAGEGTVAEAVQS